jgi:hypothetical protein
MDFKRGENALQQLEKGSVSLNELLQDMQSLAHEVSELDKIQKVLVETDLRLNGVIKHFDDKLLNALSPILQELSIRLKDTSENLTSVRMEVASQLGSLGGRIDSLESLQFRTQRLQKATLILIGVTCIASLGVLFLIGKPLLN